MATVPGYLAVQQTIDATAQRVVTEDALQCGPKGLAAADAATLLAEVEAEFGTPLKPDVAQAVDRICKNSTGREQARTKWGRAKGLLNRPQPSRPPDAGGPSLRDWLLEGDDFANAVQGVRMQGTASAKVTDTRGYILWTGGAADCVAIATYDPKNGLAWLTHATALSLSNPAELILDFNPGKRKDLKIYLSSQKPQAGLEGALKDRGWAYEIEKTGKLAINARTGKTRFAFDIEGLPK